MSQCEYERTGDGDDGQHRYKCTHCGHERQSKYPANMLHRRCAESKPTLRHVTKFAVAAALHVMRGSPKRTAEEIDRLYEICKTCDKFRNDNCRLCGCCVTRNKVYRNKLAWADQHCEEGRW